MSCRYEMKKTNIMKNNRNHLSSVIFLLKGALNMLKIPKGQSNS